MILVHSFLSDLIIALLILCKVHELAEQIGKQLAKAEQMGAEGFVEESMKLMEEVEDLRKKKLAAEQEYRNSMPASSYQQQKLRVCEVCSAYLGIHDNDRRLADHFGGKLHLGFIKIREKLTELQVIVDQLCVKVHGPIVIVDCRKPWRRGGKRKKRRGTKRGKSEILTVGLNVLLVGSAETVTALHATPGDPKVVKDPVASHAPAPGLAAMKGSFFYLNTEFLLNQTLFRKSRKSRSRSRDRRRRSRSRDRRRSRSNERRRRDKDRHNGKH
jgi:hypothetical protein